MFSFIISPTTPKVFGNPEHCKHKINPIKAYQSWNK